MPSVPPPLGPKAKAALERRENVDIPALETDLLDTVRAHPITKGMEQEVAECLSAALVKMPLAKGGGYEFTLSAPTAHEHLSKFLGQLRYILGLDSKNGRAISATLSVASSGDEFFLKAPAVLPIVQAINDAVGNKDLKIDETQFARSR